jgi:hypothetical protein
MKQFLVIIAIAMFCGTVSAQAPATIKPAKKYKQNGMTFVSPDSAGWKLLKTDGSETAFEKRSESDILNAYVKSVPTKTFATDHDRLVAWEALKQEEFNKYKQDHLHFNYTKFKGSTCLLYDAIFPTDKTPTNDFAYYNLRGYLCPIPGNKDLAVQIEFSDRSNTRAFTDDLSDLNEKCFEGLMFSDGSKK